jgi:hypothetical protein
MTTGRKREAAEPNVYDVEAHGGVIVKDEIYFRELRDAVGYGMPTSLLGTSHYALKASVNLLKDMEGERRALRGVSSEQRRALSLIASEHRTRIGRRRTLRRTLLHLVDVLALVALAIAGWHAANSDALVAGIEWQIPVIAVAWAACRITITQSANRHLRRLEKEFQDLYGAIREIGREATTVYRRQSRSDAPEAEPYDQVSDEYEMDSLDQVSDASEAEPYDQVSDESEADPNDQARSRRKRGGRG